MVFCPVFARTFTEISKSPGLGLVTEALLIDPTLGSCKRADLAKAIRCWAVCALETCPISGGILEP